MYFEPGKGIYKKVDLRFCVFSSELFDQGIFFYNLHAVSFFYPKAWFKVRLGNKGEPAIRLNLKKYSKHCRLGKLAWRHLHVKAPAFTRGDERVFSYEKTFRPRTGIVTVSVCHEQVDLKMIKGGQVILLL